MLPRIANLTLGLVAIALPATVITWTANLEPRPGSMITGTASLESAGTDSSHVQIRVEHARPGAKLPWHVHEGKCGANGAVLGTASWYTPLQVDQNGVGNSEAMIPLKTPEKGEYSVNVHKSESDMTPIACGALLQGMAGDSVPMQP